MIDFTVTVDGGESYEVKATARDVLVWERTGKNKVFAQLMDDMSMVDMYKLAWLASRRQDMIDKSVTLEQFETDYELEFEEDETAADPTLTARSADRLSLLRSRLESLPVLGPERAPVQS